MRVDEYNGKALGMVKVQARKIWLFSINEFFEEHWLSRFGSYLWYWGVESMGEIGGTRDKRK